MKKQLSPETRELLKEEINTLLDQMDDWHLQFFCSFINRLMSKGGVPH